MSANRNTVSVNWKLGGGLLVLLGILIIVIWWDIGRRNQQHYAEATAYYATSFMRQTLNVPTDTPTPAPTTTSIIIPFEDVCSYVGRRVTVTGRLTVSAWTSCIGNSCFITLDSTEESDFGIFLYIKVGSEANQMEPLPSPYTFDDLKVWTDDGKIAVYDDVVTVTGMVGELREPCNVWVDTIRLP
jgi:hypothetical protein